MKKSEDRATGSEKKATAEEQECRRSWTTTIRKLQWSEEKLQKLKEEESKGRVEATLLRMTLERIREQSLDDQERIKKAHKNLGRWPNGEKILPSEENDDEEWTPDPGQTKVVSPEDEEEESDESSSESEMRHVLGIG